MRSSYSEEDVVLLLKDITGMVQPQSTQERERLIQSGRHYSEMLPMEYVPTEEYMEVYREALETYAGRVAEAVGVLADRVLEARGRDVVFVSLARAGIPIGILLKRYFRRRYQMEVPHYAISIIRGRCIDGNAMEYLLARYRPAQLLFVDGWVGKGAILNELRKDVRAYPGVSPQIAVIADPANVTGLCGTHEDILIPSACLGCTVSGLVSRTFLREDLIGEKDFHGAVYYGELKDSDLSYEFIEAVERASAQGRKEAGGNEGEGREKAGGNEGESREKAGGNAQESREKAGDGGPEGCGEAGSAAAPGLGIDEVRKIAADFGVEDLNFVKPGIGETTRVLLRRVPWKVLIDERYRGSRELRHVVRLAEEKQVPVAYYPLVHYKCCGIIKKLADI